MLKITSIHEIFDKRKIAVPKLKQNIIEVDFNIEFDHLDERKAMLKPTARIKISVPDKEILDYIMLFDDGIITRKYKLSDQEKEYIKQHTINHLELIIEECSKQNDLT